MLEAPAVALFVAFQEHFVSTQIGGGQGMTVATIPYSLSRVGVVMSPSGDRLEGEGMLNPAAGRAPDGLHPLPRLVADGNVSRVGLAEVLLDDGVPAGVERRGVVLEPDEAWERGHGHAGVEDPRMTWVPALGLHLMTYVADGPLGPRPAPAVSRGPGRVDPPRAAALRLPAGPRHPSTDQQQRVRYEAGALLLDPGDPARVLARTAQPLLSPEAPEETTAPSPTSFSPPRSKRSRTCSTSRSGWRGWTARARVRGAHPRRVRPVRGKGQSPPPST
jgi:hypothetical protein